MSRTQKPSSKWKTKLLSLVKQDGKRIRKIKNEIMKENYDFLYNLQEKSRKINFI